MKDRYGNTNGLVSKKYSSPISVIIVVTAFGSNIKMKL